MNTLKWTPRTLITVTIALILTGSLLVMGVWLLWSGEPGTGMMETQGETGMMESRQSPSHSGPMMGAPANRGLWGGYTGVTGLVMIVAFVSMVSLLIYGLFRERPGQPQPASCWSCERPVETDWTLCAYCGASRAEGTQSPQRRQDVSL